MSPERLKGAVIALVALVALVGALVYGSGSDGDKDAVDILRKGAARGALPTAIMAAYDTDGDDEISETEFPGSADRFKVLDGDGDGAIQIRDLGRSKTAKSADGKQARKPGRGFVKKHDKDDDKRLNDQEYPGSPDQFAKLDVDGDGLLSGLEAAFRPAGVGEKGKKGKGKKGKGGKGKGGKNKSGAEGEGKTDAATGAAPDEAESGGEGGIDDKVERKNRNPKDTLTFHSADDDAAAEEPADAPADDGEAP